MSWLGSWFLTIGAAFLQLAGVLFDLLVKYVLVGFKEMITTLNILPAIEIGWSVFRDFANIMIIGVFTFFAIAMILGIKSYGQKQMIARVLMVAVLINFSLLFTKIIIDASNYTAWVIYKQMAASNESFDMAQAFLTPMNITSAWDTKHVTDQVANNTNSGMQAFTFGLVGGIMLLAAAAVLFYGCFLIAARAIMFIFLMLTSSLAFATYLLPNLQKGKFGWDIWWKSLINAAVFAPLLMIFLFISLSIINAAGSVSGGTTLGAAITDPQTMLATNNGWVTIMVYLIGIGLLFLSFKLASSLASGIPGFSLASMATALPFTLGSRVAGFALRNTVGRGAARRGLELDDEIEAQRNKARSATGGTQLKEYAQLERLMRSKQRTDTRAGSSFNVMNTTGAKAIMSSIGVKGFAAGADTKAPSYMASAKARAEKAAKEASGLSLSRDDRTAVENEAAEKKRDELRRDRENKKLQREQSMQSREAIAGSIKQGMSDLQSEMKRSQGVRDALEKKHNRDISFAEEAQKSGAAGATERLAEARAKRSQELGEQDSKIQGIKDQMSAVEKPFNDLDETIKGLDREIGDLSEDKLKSHRDVRQAGQQAGEAAAKAAKGVAQEMGARMAYGGFTSALMRASGIDPKKTVSGKMAFKGTGKKINVKGSAAALQAIREEVSGAGEGTDAGGAH